jgi:hypothetical protein
LKQTACFSPVNDETKNIVNDRIKTTAVDKKTDVSTINFKKPTLKVNTLKRQVSQKKANNFTIDYKTDKDFTAVKIKPNIKAEIKFLPKSRGGVGCDEDDLVINKPTRRPSSRLPTIKTNPSTSKAKANKTINFEIDSIMNMADQYKEDAELQSKINALVKNIHEIKNVLQTKRFVTQTAPIKKASVRGKY